MKNLPSFQIITLVYPYWEILINLIIAIAVILSHFFIYSSITALFYLLFISSFFLGFGGGLVYLLRQKKSFENFINFREYIFIAGQVTSILIFQNRWFFVVSVIAGIYLSNFLLDYVILRFGCFEKIAKDFIETILYWMRHKKEYHTIQNYGYYEAGFFLYFYSLIGFTIHKFTRMDDITFLVTILIIFGSFVGVLLGASFIEFKINKFYGKIPKDKRFEISGILKKVTCQFVFLIYIFFIILLIV